MITERLRLRDGVSAATGTGGDVALVAHGRVERLGRIGADGQALLRRLASGTSTMDGDALLDRLRRHGWLHRTLEYQGRALVTVRPLAPPGGTEPPAGDGPADPPRLSRFAVLRPGAAGLVLESPLALVAIDVHDPAVVALLHALAGPGAPGDGEVVRALVDELARHGFLRTGAEDRELALRQWSHHELWFHARSRPGRHDAPCGATSWAEGVFARPTPVHPVPVATVDLDRPDLAALRAGDRPFTAVLEERRSIREHDAGNPLTARQLGEFLYRTARVRASGYDGEQEVFSRPYPSGGALHALELYPLVSRVTGLPQGLYRYDPHAHRLDRLAAPAEPLRRLLRSAAAGTGSGAPPQVLVLVTARFGTTMWKYQNIGYALLLKEVGGLFQTMYLVATAMGLAPCAVGTGDGAVFAEATGLPWPAESTVGEFTLGSRPAGA